MDFNRSTFFNVQLLPIFSTDFAAARELINKDNSSDNPALIQIAIIDSMASPDPILSTTREAKAGQNDFGTIHRPHTAMTT